ncbi:MAG: acetylxylan esterase [Verrucomicrobia bacterium]|nr:MAG: acetylxylan esterase [Verrucomicrobiota bacterium]
MHSPDKLRQELRDMLGLHPWPPRRPLHATVTGRIEKEDFVVEKLHFQSLPGLYVTANLYLPRKLDEPVPGVLYLCGHSRQVREGVSFGNKTGYQHHGIWFARHGYACLMIDTLQLGEIQGVHHGTHHLGRWWWNTRGYTPAGVETWNGIRALDYLQSRPEVDPERLGVTGRSGGGAYTWFVAALDERVKVAAPVAGLTDLRNHIVDGAIEGHCDCMFFLNTRRWDFPILAALILPRPLLIANSDQDPIFPLDGVLRVFWQAWRLPSNPERLGLAITSGPHKDTPELQRAVFEWFNRWLQANSAPVEDLPEPLFDPAELRVFDQLPADERNTTIDQTFVPRATMPEGPLSPAAEQRRLRDWFNALRSELARGWPAKSLVAGQARSGELLGWAKDRGVLLGWVPVHETFQVPLLQLDSVKRLHTRLPDRGLVLRPGPIRVVVCDQPAWEQLGRWLREHLEPTPNGLSRLDALFLPPTGAEAEPETGWLETQLAAETTIAFLAPRGVGPTAWSGDERTRVHIRRRFMLLGQTVDSMRVWDITQALEWLKAGRFWDCVLAARGPMAMDTLLAALLVPNTPNLELDDLPASWEEAPDYIGLARRIPFEALELMLRWRQEATRPR